MNFHIIEEILFLRTSVVLTEIPNEYPSKKRSDQKAIKVVIFTWCCLISNSEISEQNFAPT